MLRKNTEIHKKALTATFAGPPHGAAARRPAEATGLAHALEAPFPAE